MTSVEMNITCYRPKTHRLWQPTNADGEGRAQIYTRYGLVVLFTYRAGPLATPFTTLQMVHGEMIYNTRLPRHYKERWWLRLADWFAWRVTAELAPD